MNDSAVISTRIVMTSVVDNDDNDGTTKTTEITATVMTKYPDGQHSAMKCITMTTVFQTTIGQVDALIWINFNHSMDK